jgi:hypothetical protein
VTPAGGCAERSQQASAVHDGMGEVATMAFLLDTMKNTKSNDESFASMRR